MPSHFSAVPSFVPSWARRYFVCPFCAQWEIRVPSFQCNIVDNVQEIVGILCVLTSHCLFDSDCYSNRHADHGVVACSCMRCEVYVRFLRIGNTVFISPSGCSGKLFTSYMTLGDFNRPEILILSRDRFLCPFCAHFNYACPFTRKKKQRHLAAVLCIIPYFSYRYLHAVCSNINQRRELRKQTPLA